MRRRHDLARRRFLQTLGTSAALLPFLPRMNAEAGGFGAPRRLIIFYFPVGTLLSKWRCTGSENDFQLSPILAPLERHRDEIVILDGIDNAVSSNIDNMAGHQSILGWWTGVGSLPGDFPLGGGETFGWASGPSVDQSIADAFYGQTPLRSLDLGVKLFTGGHAPVYSTQSYRGANEPVTPIQDPAQAFQYMFGDFDLDTTQATKIRRGRQSVFDFVTSELSTLEGNLVGDEREKLQAHLENLRVLEKRVQNQVGANCEIPPQPEEATCRGNSPVDCNDTLNSAMFDLITSALKCDLTRVVAFQATAEHDGPAFPEYASAGHPHSVSHRRDAESQIIQTRITEYWMEQLALLLDRLAAVPEGDGTMLDNTLVVTACALGENWLHGNRNCPVVLAGRSGGYVQTGRYLRFGNYATESASPAAHGGRNHNDLLISMCHAVGLTDVSTFGEPSFCTGPIEEIMG